MVNTHVLLLPLLSPDPAKTISLAKIPFLNQNMPEGAPIDVLTAQMATAYKVPALWKQYLIELSSTKPLSQPRDSCWAAIHPFPLGKNHLCVLQGTPF
jgi:hypothetical protein